MNVERSQERTARPARVMEPDLPDASQAASPVETAAQVPRLDRRFFRGKNQRRLAPEILGRLRRPGRNGFACRAHARAQRSGPSGRAVCAAGGRPRPAQPARRVSDQRARRKVVTWWPTDQDADKQHEANEGRARVAVAEQYRPQYSDRAVVHRIRRTRLGFGARGVTTSFSWRFPGLVGGSPDAMPACVGPLRDRDPRAIHTKHDRS